MIFLEYAAPMPGNVSSCSLVAEFRSINSAAAFFSAGAEGFFSAAGAAFVSGFLAGAGACANPKATTTNIPMAATISLDRVDFFDTVNLLKMVHQKRSADYTLRVPPKTTYAPKNQPSQEP